MYDPEVIPADKTAFNPSPLHQPKYEPWMLWRPALPLPDHYIEAHRSTYKMLHPEVSEVFDKETKNVTE